MAYVIITTGIFFTMLNAVCRRVRIGSRFHRAMTRAVAALFVLVLFSFLPFARVGVNALTVACVSMHGLPGLGMLQVIALMG